MIYFYSGTPGSGKSLHVARDILTALRFKKKSVIANIPINLKVVSKNGKKNIGQFFYKDNSDLTVSYLKDFAFKHHIRGKEGQTLIVIDEAQVMFNPREWTAPDRLEWIKFFSQHRHYGYNIIMISQFDRLIDRQIRSLFEYDIKHRKINNYGIGWFIPVPAFAAVTYWYGVREKMGVEFFFYRKIYSKIYDSYNTFTQDKDTQKADRGAEGGVPDRLSGITDPDIEKLTAIYQILKTSKGGDKNDR